jgi:prolyl-tRNA synthetase
VKFKDADLLGFPLRVNIGARGLAAGELELIERQSKKTEKVQPGAVFEKIQSWVRERAT